MTGVAHVLEHMMFKGTRRFGPGEFTRRIAEAGGRDNAFTSKDVTVYHQQVHRDRLELAMQLEADRMANLLLDPTEFSREIKVVMEERRLRYEDRPRSLVYESLMAAAFSAHPYQWPVIGWMVDLEAMTWEDARDWFRRWYAPNNATVVIVGDVDTSEVLRWARRYYGGIAAKALPERKPRGEPPQRGLRRVAVKAPAELPYLRMGYKVPALRDPAGDAEPYALSVLADILAGHDAARLNQSLVREQRIATSAGASYDLITPGPGYAHARRGCRPGEDRRRARSSVARKPRGHRRRRRICGRAGARQGPASCARGVQARLHFRAGARDRRAGEHGAFVPGFRPHRGKARRGYRRAGARGGGEIPGR